MSVGRQGARPCSVTLKVDKWERKSEQGEVKSLTTVEMYLPGTARRQGSFSRRAPVLLGQPAVIEGSGEFFSIKIVLFQMRSMQSFLARTK